MGSLAAGPGSPRTLGLRQASKLDQRPDDAREAHQSHRTELASLESRDRGLVQATEIREPLLCDPGALAAPTNDLTDDRHAVLDHGIAKLLVDPSIHVPEDGAAGLSADHLRLCRHCIASTAHFEHAVNAHAVGKRLDRAQNRAYPCSGRPP